MSFYFGRGSEYELSTCEGDLVKVARLALKYSSYDFGVIQGIRTKQEQKLRVKEGKSQTLASRHLANENGLSEAIDIAVYDEHGELTWEVGYYRKVMQAFVRAAIELGIQIEFGGLWKSFVDAGHIQLMEV